MQNDTFVINLERRPDRLVKMKEQLAKADISNYSIFPAFDNGKLQLLDSRNQGGRLGNSYIGVYLSHLSVIKVALSLDLKEVTIFEDDVFISPDFSSQLQFAKKQLPTDWDMLYLHHGGSNILGKESYTEQLSESIFRTGYIGSFAGYVLTNSGIKKVLPILEQAIDDHCDITLARFNYDHQVIKAYCVCPSIVEINTALGSDNI